MKNHFFELYIDKSKQIEKKKTAWGPMGRPRRPPKPARPPRWRSAE